MKKRQKSPRISGKKHGSIGFYWWVYFTFSETCEYVRAWHREEHCHDLVEIGSTNFVTAHGLKKHQNCCSDIMTESLISMGVSLKSKNGLKLYSYL